MWATAIAGLVTGLAGPIMGFIGQKDSLNAQKELMKYQVEIEKEKTKQGDTTTDQIKIIMLSIGGVAILIFALVFLTSKEK